MVSGQDERRETFGVLPLTVPLALPAGNQGGTLPKRLSLISIKRGEDGQGGAEQHRGHAGSRALCPALPGEKSFCGRSARQTVEVGEGGAVEVADPVFTVAGEEDRASVRRDARVRVGDLGFHARTVQAEGDRTVIMAVPELPERNPVAAVPGDQGFVK